MPNTAPDRELFGRDEEPSTAIPPSERPLYRNWFLASAIHLICFLFQIWIFSIDSVISNQQAQIYLHSQSIWIPLLLIWAAVLGWNIRDYFARCCALGLVYFVYEASYVRY